MDFESNGVVKNRKNYICIEYSAGKSFIKEFTRFWEKDIVDYGHKDDDYIVSFVGLDNWYETTPFDLSASNSRENGNMGSKSQEVSGKPDYIPKKIEQYYPLHEGYKYNSMYPDYCNYHEEVVLRYDNLALLTETHGGKSSDIKVYQVEDDVIYEVLSLEEDSKANVMDYREIMNLVINRDENKLITLLKSQKITSRKVVLKVPLAPGTAWEGGRIVDYNAEKAFKSMPEFLVKDLTLPDKEIIVVKYDNYYKFLKKDKGVVIMYYTNLEYRE